MKPVAVRVCTDRHIYCLLVALSTLAYGLLAYYRTKARKPHDDK